MKARHDVGLNVAMHTSHLGSRRHYLNAKIIGPGTLALSLLLKQDGLRAAPVKPELVGSARDDLLPKQRHFKDVGRLRR